MYEKGTQTIRDIVYESVKDSVSLDSTPETLNWGQVQEQLRQIQGEKDPSWNISIEEASPLEVKYSAESENGEYLVTGIIEGTLEGLEYF